MKNVVLMLILTGMSYATCGQELKGDWRGALSVQGSQFRIVFHISKSETQYKATMDSPDQGANDIPVTVTNFSYPEVKFEIPTIGMIYEGTLSGNQITGKWMQAQQSFPLVLVKFENPPTEKN